MVVLPRYSVTVYQNFKKILGSNSGVRCANHGSYCFHAQIFNKVRSFESNSLVLKLRYLSANFDEVFGVTYCRCVDGDFRPHVTLHVICECYVWSGHAQILSSLHNSDINP